MLLCFILLSMPVSTAMGGPEGAAVVNGQVSIQQSGYNTTITASDRAIINYSSFDIARAETVQFVQPSSSASVLNRILSANPTNINGTLLANGRVFFVNPAGVYFGSGARVNVNGLVASALNMTNEDFINGQLNFADGKGSVINSGDISAESVYLIGQQVSNLGNISCPDGYVVMVAGDRVFLGEPGSDIVVEIDVPDLRGEVYSGVSVLNEGSIEAVGGIISLVGAGDLYSQAISNVGSISASSEIGKGGEVRLSGIDGTVINSGSIDASGIEGGQVTLEGERVGQFGTIYAHGIDSHGGTVNLMGSEVVALGSGSVTTANAGTNGDGGEVIVYSPDTALFRYGAMIEAKGGIASGDGGFVEVSGKQYVEVDGFADRTAVNGEHGVLLIDPADIAITDNAVDDPEWTGDDFAPRNPSGSPSEIDIDTLELHLSGGPTTITTAWDDQGDPGSNPDPGEEGNVTFNAGRDVSYNGTNSFTVNADGSIFFESGSGIAFTGTGDITLNVGGEGSVNLNADISTGGELSGNATLVNVLSNAAQIQDGIDIAGASATVSVFGDVTDTYNEDLRIATEGLELTSATGNAGDVIIKGVDYEAWGDWPLANPNIDIQADGVSIHDLTIASPDVPDGHYSSGIVLTGENIQIYDNIFTSTGAGDGGNVVIQTYDQSVMANSDISGLNIYGNSFSGSPGGGYVGVFINRDNDTGETGDVTIDDNIFSGNVVQGIVTERSNTLIQNNEITTVFSGGLGVIVMDWSHLLQDSVEILNNTISDFEYGILIGDSGGLQSLTNINVKNNTIANNTTGVQVRSSAEGVFVNNNAITNNSDYSVQNTDSGQSLDATANWWGDSGGASLSGSDKVSSDVDYSPWWAVNHVSDASHQTQWTWGLSDLAGEWAGWLGNFAQAGDTLELHYTTATTLPELLDGGLGVNLDITSTDSILIGDAVDLQGDLTLEAGTSLDVDAKVTVAGEVDLLAGTTLTVNQSIDPAIVNLTSNGDLIINNSVTADNKITATAGNVTNVGNVVLDVAGSLLTESPGSDIEITAGSTTGNISLDGTVTAVDQVTMTAFGGTINGGGLVTASVVDIDADTGIGNTTALELAASTITADTASGNIDIDNSLDGAVTVSTLTTGDGGTILFENTGSGGVNFDTVSTTADVTPIEGEDDISLSSDGGDLTVGTSVTAAGAGDIDYSTTNGGNILLNGTTTASGDEVKMDSVGSINGNGLVTASVVDLDAETGIGDTTALELAASTITADSASGNVDIDNSLAGAVTVSTLTTADGGTILFENTGSGGVSFGTVSTTEDVTPIEGEDDITLRSDGGDLTIATSVTAAGAGDIDYSTTNSGDIVLGGTTTASGDEVTMDSAGSINDASDDEDVDITADVLTLTAREEIGGNPTSGIKVNDTLGAIETDVTSLEAHSTTGGDIVIVEKDTTTQDRIILSDVDTADGAIDITVESAVGAVGDTVLALVDAGGGGDEDDVDVTAAAGDITVGSVSAAGSGDVTVEATEGSINDASDDVDGVDITADVLTLTALDDIGGTPSAGMITDVLGALETTISSLEAHSTTGDIVIFETDDIELKNVDTVSGGIDILAKGNMAVSNSVAGSDIKASENIMLYAGTDGSGNLSFEADVQLDSPAIFLRAGDGPGGAGTDAEVVMNDTPTVVAETLGIRQDGSMGIQDDPATPLVNENDPWNPIVGDNANIDLKLMSDDGSIYSTYADSWKSITATALNNIELSGFGDIKIASAGLSSTEGGVMIVSTHGTISTPGAGGFLNAPITGSSNGTSGVLLPFVSEEGQGKAAIVIRCLSKDLKLGPDAVLTANGDYNPVSFDDRSSILFTDDGDPIDVAIYLGSFGFLGNWRGGNVEMGSGRVSIRNSSGIPSTIGSLVIDAYDTVNFSGLFDDSLAMGGASTVEWLEVVSRISDSLNSARSNLTLPHADNFSNIANRSFHGKYVLRGDIPAKILGFIDPVPLVPPRAEEVEDKGSVETIDIESMLEALRELGIYGVDLARAYTESLNTDVAPHWTSIERLLELAKRLQDTGDTYFVSLRGVVSDVVSADQPPDETQMATIAQGLSDRAGSSTEYALVKQWLDDMSEYVGILVSDIHQPDEKAVKTVMVNYGGFLQEEFRTDMFVQWYLGRSFGG